MKLVKRLIGVLIVVLVIVVGALWWVYASKDELVREAIEKYGPEIVAAPVSVKQVKLDPLEGKGRIAGLRIGNPKGYSAPDALKLGEMRLTLDPASVTKDVIVVKELVLVAPDVTWERANGLSNVEAIQKNIDAYVARTLGPSEKKSDAPAKKFVIEHLYVKDAKVHYGTALSMPLPDLHLRDIGKKSNGATAGEVAKQTWDAIAHGAMNLASRAGTAVKDGAQSVVKGVKGLFGK